MAEHRQRDRGEEGSAQPSSAQPSSAKPDQQDKFRQRERNPLSAWALLLRSVSFRRTQTAVIAGTAALIMATAVFAPWFNHLVDQAVTTQAFQSGRPGSSWQLTGPGGSDPESLLPAASRELFEDPVAGLQAKALWHSPKFSEPAEGGMVWRDDICQHLEMTSGRCPEPTDTEPVQVAVSDVDAKTHDLKVGSKIAEQGTISTPVQFVVTGVYRLKDPAEAYWFGVIPTGRSLLRPDEAPRADQFVVAEDAFTVGTKRPYDSTLDLRVHAATVTAADVPLLRTDTATLLIEGKRHETVLSTEMPELLDRLERGWQVAATSLGLVVGQIAVLAIAVLGMLARVVLIQRRTEIGLGRLRGQGSRRLVRTLSAEWALVVLVGGIGGSLIGVGAVLAARARWLPSMPPLDPPWTVGAAAAGALLVAFALMVLMAGPTVREPVVGLLRSVGSRSETSGSAQLIVDAVAITVAGCGVLVGLQSPENSALVLLTPSLLAIAASVLLARLLTVGASRLARRWMANGRSGAALATIMLTRGRGTRSLLTVLCIACAFAIFSTQMTAVSHRNREHRAELEAGAMAVAETTAKPYDVVKALDDIDPGRDRATMVVNTHRADAGALGAMFVEPEPFQRIALGAGEAATSDSWQMIKAPDVDPIELTGSSLTVTVEPHTLVSEGAVEQPPKIVLTVDYLQPNGSIGTAAMGAVPLQASHPQRLTSEINCGEGCALLRWNLNPDGPMAGSLRLSEIGTAERAGGPPSPVGQGTTQDWKVPTEGVQEATVRPDDSALQVDFRSGGSTVAFQHAYLPTQLSALMAAVGKSGGDGGVATVTTPGETIMPISTEAVAVAPIPRSLSNVAVADVASVLRRGETPVSTTTVQLWFSAQGLKERATVKRELAEHKIEIVPVDTLEDYRSHYSAAPESLVSLINPIIGLLAVLLAGLGLVLSVAASWRGRSRDLAALRMVGVRDNVLNRAVVGLHLFMVLATVLIGAVCGLVGYVLAIRRMPMFSEPQPVIPVDLAVDRPTGFIVLGLLVVVLGLVAGGCGRWLLARSDLGRVREAGE